MNDASIPKPMWEVIAEMPNRAANARLDKLREEHPEVVDAVTATVEIASPQAGPQRLLIEVLFALEMDR